MGFPGRLKSFLQPLFSELNKHKLIRSYKYHIAIVLTAALLIATGIYANINAVSPEDGQVSNFVPAYKVILNGADIGYVKDAASVDKVLERIKQDSIKKYTMDVDISANVVLSAASVSPSDILSDDSLIKAVNEHITVKVKAYSLTVNGEEIGVLRSESEIEGLLSRIKAPYTKAEGSTVESVTFVEDVRVIPKSVYFDEVRSAAAIAGEIEAGRETVEEYTVSEGDTMWSIAKAHGISFDELAAMNSDLADVNKLKLGQKLRLSYPKSLLNVVTVELAHYEESIAYETETRKDDSMYKNDSKVLQKGQDGLKLVEARVRKVNGIEKGRDIISENIIRQPVSRIVAKGTKSLPALASRGGGALFWPAQGVISSRFGSRWGRNHNGLDIANSTGTKIYAAESGKVVYSSYNSGGYGNLIKIDHGDGLVTYYGHLKTRLVKVGDRVERGQLIGYMGSTGRSTGPHLHFEVRIYDNPKNPSKYLP